MLTSKERLRLAKIVDSLDDMAADFEEADRDEAEDMKRAVGILNDLF